VSRNISECLINQATECSVFHGVLMLVPTSLVAPGVSDVLRQVIGPWAGLSLQEVGRNHSMGLCRVCAAGAPGACSNAKGCETQRENLIEEATLTAGLLGHSVSGFTKRNGAPVWQAKCRLCGCVVTVSLDPADSREGVYGEAVTAACEESGKTGNQSKAE
jgi:hypothetical protein